MDSRSGPELPHKVHAFRETVKGRRPDKHSLGAKATGPTWRASALAIVATLALHACGSGNKSVEGAIAAVASAVGSRDHGALFDTLDERARRALASVYRARTRAAEVIRADYPADAQPGALAELGDAVHAESAVDLFRKRCDEHCMSDLASRLGAPQSVREEGPLHVIQTVRGTELTLYRGEDGRYGLVWETAALVRERTRAAAELDLVEKNGASYRAQRALKAADP